MSVTYGTQNDLLMNTLLKFYEVYSSDGTFNPNNNLDKMLNVITGASKISLRIVDWFTTNYSKKYFVVYATPEIARFKVYQDYRLNLKAYSKRRFDPFCRWDRIKVPYVDGTLVETTIGQLNFFKWALENNVLIYVMEHYDSIEHDMNVRNSNSRRNMSANANATAASGAGAGAGAGSGATGGGANKTRKKREELSISASKSIKMEDVKIVMAFK
jgi:hypothetical protein